MVAISRRSRYSGASHYGAAHIVARKCRNVHQESFFCLLAGRQKYLIKPMENEEFCAKMCRRQTQFRPQPAAYSSKHTSCKLVSLATELPLGKTVKLVVHSQVPFRILLSMHVRDRRIPWEACKLIVYRM